MRRALALALLLLTVIPAADARAQTSAGVLADYTVASWTDRDNLPSARIWSIVQDTDGYLWLGTDAGVVRFDGVRFVPLDTLVQPPPPDGNTLMAGRDGSLWIAFDSAGIGRVKNGRLRVFGESDGMGSGFIYALLEDHAGTVWGVGRDGLLRLRNERWERLGTEQGIPDGSILAVFEDRQRRMWIASRTAVLRRAGGEARFEQMELAKGPGFLTPRFSEDATGGVWMTDRSQGFRRIDGAAPTPSTSADGSGVDLLHDRRGNLWVATQGRGLWRVREADGAATVEAMTTRDGLVSDAVKSLLEDREGNLWVGTYSGLHRFSPRRVSAVTELGIARALAASADGTLWVATASGLTKIAGGTSTHYSERDGLPGPIVLSLRIDREGVLWVGTDRGIARRVGNRFVPLQMQPGLELSRPMSLSRVNDTLWVRDIDRGILRWKDGVATRFDLPPEFRRSIYTMRSDRSGRVWLGSNDGRVGTIQPDGSVQSYDFKIGNVATIYEDRAGTIWAGGTQGISRFAAGTLAVVKRAQGIPLDVFSLMEDEGGVLWAGVSGGIARFDPDEFMRAVADPGHTLQFRIFDTSDGAAGAPSRSGDPKVVRAGDGRLWFMTESGLTVIDPRRLGEPRPAPPVRIESALANAKPVATVLDAELPARTTHLQIAFTSLTLTDPGRVRFRYLLEGFDEEWIDAGTTRQATYTNLPPGSYRFRVVARNNDGTSSEPGAAWAFSILPTFYQTRTFYLFCAVVVALLTWGAWKFRVAQVRRQFAAVLGERIRMSRAIHDTLLQGLVGLALQFNDLSRDVESSPPASEKISRIRKQVEEYIREARSAIWDLRSPKLETRDLATALREAAERAIGGKDVQFDFAVSGTPRKVAPGTEEQILLIGQEAVSNAVRHGKAGRIAMSLRYEPERIGLRVRDDGCGFDVDVVRRAGGKHYGLASMRERAEQVRGFCKVVSAPGTGTEIEAVVPTTS